MSVMEQLKALDAQRSKLLEGARDEALKLAHDAVAALRDLGYHFNLVEGAPTKGKTSKARASASREKRDTPCPICHFKTDPPHDARSHRSQTTKKPFTAAELHEKGLVKA